MTIEIYTDGSCITYKNKRFAGIGIHFPNHEFDDISNALPLLRATNQRAELYAILVALQTVCKQQKNITIFTDSLYSIMCLTQWVDKWKQNKWKTVHNKCVLNKDLIKDILTIKDNFSGIITFIHVYGHKNNLGNIIADKLATRASNKLRNNYMLSINS